MTAPLEQLVETWRAWKMSPQDISDRTHVLEEKFSPAAIQDFAGLYARDTWEKLHDEREKSQLRAYHDRLNRLVGERRRLLADFAHKMEEYSSRVRNGETKLTIDLSDLMRNQYVLEEQVQGWIKIEDADLHMFWDVLVAYSGFFQGVKSVVDYGPGSGIKGANAYRLLKSLHENEGGRLHIIDYSYAMAAEAQSTSKAVGINEQDIIMHAPVDFEELGRLKRIEEDKNRKLHLFAGQTIGNFENPEVIIKNIVANMRGGDYLFVEWFIKNPHEYKNRKFRRFYRRLLNGILGIPVRAIGGYEPYEDSPKNWFRYLPFTRSDRWNIMPFYVRTVPESERTVIVNGTPYVLQPGTKIIVSRSRRFREREVIKLFEKNGLEGIITEQSTMVKFATGVGSPVVSISDKEEKSFVKKVLDTITPSIPIKWMKKGNKRYSLFYPSERRKEERIACAVLAACGLALFAYAGPSFVNKYLWNQATVYQPREIKNVDLDKNVERLGEIVYSLCESQPRIPLYDQLFCANPKNSDLEAVYETVGSDFKYRGGAVDMRIANIAQVYGLIPNRKRNGAIIIKKKDGKTEVIVVRKEHIAEFVQTLENARRGIEQKDAEGYEIYTGRILSEEYKVNDPPPEEITISEPVITEGQYCPQKSSSWTSLTLYPKSTVEARIRHFGDPSIIATSNYRINYHISHETVTEVQIGPQGSCVAGIVRSYSSSKEANDRDAKRIVDEVYTWANEQRK